MKRFLVFCNNVTLRWHILNSKEKLIKKKFYIKETLLRFSEIYSAVLTKTCWAFKKEETVKLAIYILSRFLQLRNISGAYSKYFQKNISESDISSEAQRSTS